MKNTNKKFKLASPSIDIVVLSMMVVLVLQLALLPLFADAASRAGGFLAKGSGPAVYFVSADNHKLVIPSAKVFLSYGYKWNQIKILSDAELAKYPDAKYVSENASAAVYFLSGTGKRYVTQAAASVLGLKPEEIISVNRTEFRSYKTETKLDADEAVQMAAANAISAVGQQTETCVPDPNAGGADGCALYNASAQNNPDLCAQINNPDYLPSCYAMFDAPTGTPATFYCNKLSDTNLNEMCVSRVAVKTKDASLCNSINNPANKNLCLAGVGVSAGDVDKCLLLPQYSSSNPNVPSQDTCVYTYAILNSNLAACEKLSSTSPFYASCLKFSVPANTNQ